MRKEFTMTQEEMDAIIELNKTHSNVPMIALQCGTPKGLRQLINEYWDRLGVQYGFDPCTVDPSPNGPLAFTAESTNVESVAPESKYDSLATIVGQLESCGYECVAGPLEMNVAFQELQRMAKGREG